MALARLSNVSRRELLYEKCAESPAGTVFYQNDLTNIKDDNGNSIVPDVPTLMALCQELVDIHLFQIMTWDGQTCWKTRTRDEAAKIKGMSPDERLIYNHIESSGNTGIWTKTIKAKTNIPQTLMTKCLRSLESKALIKSINNVRFPTRKMYMLAHLIPSEEVSGGPWHQDGELDQDLIDELSRVIYTYVERESWAEQPALPKDRLASSVQKKKDAVLSSTSAEPPRYKPPLGPKGRPMIPHPPGYRHYPTTGSVLRFIVSSGILGPNISLQEADLQNLMDLLVYDGKIEKINALSYRSVRVQPDEGEGGPGNGFTEAPCGHCPVFDLCEEGGPVNAGNCVYFDDWLKS